jgi:RNA polymerase sigma-70 factor (ECF subfamily)
VAAIFQGDRRAEAALFERYYQSTLYILERQTGDAEQAQDLCQEALCILIERLRTQPLAEPDKLAGFLYSIARKLHIADVRKSIRRKTFNDQDLMARVADRSQNQLRALIQSRASAAVRTLIAGMDNLRDRKLLYGFYIEEKEKEDLCAELDLSLRHFDKVIFRAKQRFKELLLEDKP